MTNPNPIKVIVVEGLMTNRIRLMAEAMELLGDDVITVDMDQLDIPSRTFGDVVLTWGMPKREQRVLGVHSLVMEQGFIGDRKNNYYLGWDGLNGYGRWHTRSGAGTTTQALHTEDYRIREIADVSRVLLLGQCPGDATVGSIGGHEYCWWLENIIAMCEGSGWSVRFRNHPRHIGFPLCSLDTEGNRLSRSLWEDLRWADMAVGYSSNSLVDAALAGVPVVCGSRQSLAAPVGGTMLRLNVPSPAERRAWLDHVMSAQHTQAEVKSGLAWSRLKKCL